MRAGRVSGGLLWAEGRIVLREVSPGRDFGRLLESRKPFALIGRMVGADIRLDERTVSPRHAYLHLNEQGLFGVDLATGSGTRFSGAALSSRWLRPGDGIEISGRRLVVEEIRLDGKAIDPVSPSVSPLEASREDAALAEVKLFPENSGERPWALGSELVFLGRGEACGILVKGASVSKTHCVLYRTPSSVYAIDLLGQHTSINGRPLRGARRLVDGDALSVGRSRFRVEIEPAVISVPTRNATSRNVAPRPNLRAPEESLSVVDSERLAPPFPPSLSNLGVAAADWVFQALRPGHDEFLRRQEELRRTMDRMFREIRRDPDAPDAPDAPGHVMIPVPSTSNEPNLKEVPAEFKPATPPAETAESDEGPRERSRLADPPNSAPTLPTSPAPPFDRPDTGPSTTWLLRRMSAGDSREPTGISRRLKFLDFLRRLFS